MKFQKGNTISVGNDGGRPPIYSRENENDVNKVSELCESFFEDIKTKDQPPTVTGLTLHLGFSAKSTLYDYAKIAEFSNSIKRALLKIEQYHEIATAYGDKCTGNIFVLKNFGWKDTIDTNHSGEIKTSQPTIIFKKFKDE